MKIAYHPEIGKVLHWFCKTRLLKNDAVYVYVSRNCIHTFFSFEKNYIFWHCWWMIRNKNQKTRKRVLFYRKSSNLVSKDKYALKLSENAKNSRFLKLNKNQHLQTKTITLTDVIDVQKQKQENVCFCTKNHQTWF